MKSTRSATAPDTHGPLTVRVLTDLTARQQFDAFLEAEHFLAPRFRVPAAARRPNLASQTLAAAPAVLPDQWFAQCGYAPLLAEAFTDPEAHAGTCYKAAGWEPLGQTVG